MKHLILFLLTLSSLNTNAQIVIGQPELVMFYRGYDNKLEAASQNGVKRIKLQSKDFEFIENSDKKAKKYSCIARVTSSATTSTIYMLNRRTEELIDSFRVSIRPLPAPSLFFGASEPGAVNASRLETKFFVKYLPENPLSAYFRIVSGTIRLPDNSLLYFSGNELGETEANVLKNLPENSTIWVEVYTIGPDGRWRIVKSTFRI